MSTIPAQGSASVQAPNGTPTLQAWKKFSAFEVFGDYRPMTGFRLVIKVGADHDALAEAIERRAGRSELLDPQLASSVMRAGLGLARSGLVSFVYATCENAVVLVRPEAVTAQRSPLEVQNQLLAMFTARLALLTSVEVGSQGHIYEFPDVAIVRRALSTLAEEVEESTPLRSSIWLGAQLRGKGQPFHRSMIETLEEQTSLLQSNGIDMDALPPWWWRGIAAQVGSDGGIEVIDELPTGDEFGRLIVG